MALHVHCSTDQAVLLAAVACPDGLLRFPNDEIPWPGLGVNVKPLVGINEQLLDRAKEVFGPALASQLSIWQDYSDMIRVKDEDLATLYVAILRPSPDQLESLPWQTWRTLPDLIRSLPKDRTRLAYLKAWQVLTGALEETTKALDVDEVARYLKSIEAEKN